MSWQQQGVEPLFPDIVWARPETKHGAGKLLIIGGQAQEFKNVAESYNAADAAGAGSIRVFMPDSTYAITKMLPHIEYAPSNPSGSFGSNALAELLDAAHWADTVLLAGDLGKNSETTLLLESFIGKYTGALVIARDAIQSLAMTADILLQNSSTTFILQGSDLQKIGIDLKLTTPITSLLSQPQYADVLEKITHDYPALLVVENHGTTWCAQNAQVVSTKKIIGDLAPKVAVWTMQQPSKKLQAAASAIVC